MNTFGRLLTLTTFGESHGSCVGGVVDGFPAGVVVDRDFVQHEMDRRKPDGSTAATTRHEDDKVEILSGVFDGISTGCPIGFVIRNRDCRTADYEQLKDVFRPSHADFTYQQKYGVRDWRGGGRSSARETACWVAAGALAKMALRKWNINICAYVSQVGDVRLTANDTDKLQAIMSQVKAEGDTIGGVVNCLVSGCPAGLGNPVADKLHVRLGSAMLGINAAHGFDYGDGFEGVALKGSEQNDAFKLEGGRITTATNHSGGIQGGISNGQDIRFRVLFKPVPTIMLPQHTISTDGAECEFTAGGRHDSCVLPRAVPVVEAMTALVLLDEFLLWRAYAL
ncbi:MAG: chorismate synthase [Bacteroidales bacterium]|nr:chorismate synthase [Bacteroidales bacterium]